MSISRERFNQIEDGDILLMSSGKLRRVTSSRKYYASRWRVPKTILTLEKVKGFGYTHYMYADLKFKIKGIYKLKK